jgi:hypothetical protein
MFTILSVLMRTCTWSTGAWRGEAERIRYGLNRTWSVSQINRYLTRLHNCGYIDRQNVPGRRGGYRILINNYAHEEKLLRPVETKDWRDVADVDAQHSASEVRVRCVGDAQQDACEMRSIPDVPDFNLDVPNVSDVQTTSRKEGRNEGKGVPFASLTPPPVAGDAKEIENPLVTSHASVPREEKTRPPWGDDDLKFIWSQWMTLAPLSSWSDNDRLAARQIVDAIGAENVLHYLKDTSQCPKTLKVTWMDFVFWASGMGAKGLTKRNIDAWRRGREAKNLREDPLLGAKPAGDGEKMRMILRKPQTSGERLELLREMAQPKKNKEYFARFLAQDDCQKCHGKNTSCPCVLMEEVISREPGCSQEKTAQRGG